jgi:hypothetical protein
MNHAYFDAVDGLYRPHKTARSPWSREQQSGLAVAGLLARAIETAPSAAPMRVARLTVDFLGAVPMAPIETRVEALRDGARMQVLKAQLLVGGATVAMATGLRVSLREGPFVEPPPLGYPGPDASPAVPVTPYFDAGHPLETRVIQRASAEGAPGVFWSRFNSQFVAGETASPVVCACMTADIVTGVAVASLAGGWRFPNADLSLYFARQPQGPWLLGVARVDVASTGVGLVVSTLADETGPFGYARQTLVISRPAAG